MTYSYRIQSILDLKLPWMDKILDIGCGNGEFTVALKDTFGARELFGIDIGVEAIKQARERGIEMFDYDLNMKPLPLESNMFNLVFAGEIIEHLMTPDNLLEEIWRVLKPSGYCIITTPNIASWNDRILLLMGWQPYSIPTHSRYRGVGTFLSEARNTTIRQPRHVSTTGGCGLPHIQFFTVRALRALMKAHGYKIVKVIGNPADEFTFPMNKVLRRIIIGLDKWVSVLCTPLASGITIVAVKCDK